jgi:uncharacterized protein (DUF433 family)
MSRYPLSLPVQLKQEAEAWAERQGISLNQFILWAVAEKVGSLRQGIDDPAFPHITYKRGKSSQPTPVLRGSGVRVETVVIASQTWQMTPGESADQYDLNEPQVKEALAFYNAHRAEIDTSIALESAQEVRLG